MGRHLHDPWFLAGLAAIAFGIYALVRAGEQDILRPVPPDSQFDPSSLAIGTHVELEHTSSAREAKTIAKHHLVEDPDYYDKLLAFHLD